MSNTKSAYPSLQRHRRKSSQPSPTSPSFPRRNLFDRAQRLIDPFSPVDSISATSVNTNSPSLDVEVPSPALDFPSTAAEHDGTYVQNGKRLPVRISEENSRPKPQVLPNVTRPFTSDSMDGKYGLRGATNNGVSNDQASRVSPNLSYARFGDSNERLSSDSAGRYADGYSATLRGFGPSSQTLDRAFQEEQPTKLNTGKKSRLNLLNPMSLLARRRSSQAQNETSNMSVNTMHVPALPDNFDPSIRGTITHDFSAPRTRRNHSYGGDGGYMDPQRRDFLSPGQPLPIEKTIPRLQPPSGPTPSHSPMFKEHFQDDRQALRPGDTAYLHNIASQSAAAGSDLGASMPAFAKKLPMRIPDQHQHESLADGLDNERPLPKPPKALPLAPPFEERPKEPTVPPPPPPPKRTPSPVISLPHPSLLPKHMTSTSSRFSFQIGEQASSAQEKLLEEKHKEFQPGRRVSKLSQADDLEDDKYDDYDFDTEDGYEEDVPLAGVDEEFDEDADDRDGFRNDIDTPAHDPSEPNNLLSLKRQSLQGFHFTPQSMTFSPTSTNHASQPTPRDDQGFPIGVAGSRSSVEYMQHAGEPEHAVASEEDKMAFFGGLGITTAPEAIASPKLQLDSHPDAFDDSDLYFDDGEFGNDHLETNADAFDEEMLDDETKIHDIPAENLRRLEAAKEAAGPEDKVNVGGFGTATSLKQLAQPKNSQHRPTTLAGLTEGNLAAYHDALANAANEAAANGKFRNVTFSQASDDDASQSQPGLVSDESRFSYNQNHSNIAEDDGYPFDDDMDDDLMIAEANAEALENDDDGFYGQEFGFYARAHGKEGSDMVNGGFFANRGSNGVKRSHSGRNNFQEPSLTPITERSEWSHRNSVASLQIPPNFATGMPGSANSLPSPGIAQLLELDSAESGYSDEDMTLSALMKLRRGAFGGSSSSVNSIGGTGHGHPGPGGSPLGYGHGPFSPQDGQHCHSRLVGSIHSLQSAGIPETDEEDEDSMEEPTLTQNTPMKKGMEPARTSTPTKQEQLVASPSQTSEGRRSDGSAGTGVSRKGGQSSHSRTSSGAESVSYARDSDGRWMLERRRTGDDGMEIYEREWLAGARI